jgi:hypothetical protein
MRYWRRNMAKILVTTGSESHTSSAASIRAKFRGGPHNGKFLYQAQKALASEWEKGQNSQWVHSTYEIPDGQEIEILGSGQTGPRGVNKFRFHRIYRVDSSAEVQEIAVDVGLRDGRLKGRLVLVKDVIEAREASKNSQLNEDF